MGKGETSLGGGASEFPATRWSRIARAGDREAPDWKEALEELLKEYWKPVYHYLRAAGRLGIEDAKDVAQGFFAELLEKEKLAALVPVRGSFRGFLKRALKNFAIDQVRHEKARRPAGGARLVSFELAANDVAYPGTDAEAVFDREWKRSVMAAALRELEATLSQWGHEEAWQVFRAYCLPGARTGTGTASAREMLGEMPEEEAEGPRTYRDVGKELGISATDVRNRLAFARGKLRGIIEKRTREYSRDAVEAAAEYCRILSV
ncbi:MAG: sigma-70 family RNA polymerase sigma factor [Planctomycetes bacterium]|nr:sigma-70 family RNA polymerase sigma factor [Planctomycetota bacterium]